MIQEFEFVDEDFKQPMAGNLICAVNGSLQTLNVPILKSWMGRRFRERTNHGKRRTTTGVAHLFAGYNPVTVQTAVPNKIETLSRGKDLSDREL